MKFLKLKARYKDSLKEFNFEGKNVLIYSKDNSVGKSTLLRMIFYALGYQIPGTVAIRFNKLYLQLTFSISDKLYKVSRNDKRYKVETDGDKYEFILPEQHIEFLKLIFNTREENIVSNILGTIYLDQDKGWTLLNRGKVIGNIHFNIEELVEGLTAIDVSEYNN